MKKLLFVLAIACCTATLTYAADSASPQATPQSSVVTSSQTQTVITPANQTTGEKIAGKLTDVADSIPLTGVVITILMGIYDFIRRKFPTKNAASLLRDVQKIFRGIAKLFSKLDQFLDKILGQNLKETPASDSSSEIKAA